MFSREDGFSQTRAFLKKGNWLIILFDQNAGSQGTLSLFLDRVASITTLPDLLQKATKARAVYICPKRLSFFRSKIELTEMEGSHSIAFDSHDILADQITNHPNGFPDWLWSHSKWKTHFYPEERFNLHSKRSLISASNMQPVGTRLFIRMPNWLGDIMMSLPIIRAIRKARPDMCMTLLCQSKYAGLLEMLEVGDHVEKLADFLSIKGVRGLLKLRKIYPECHLLFTNSLRGDLEAFLIGSPQRFGVEIAGNKRPLLTHSLKVSKKEFESRHLSKTWEAMIEQFGYKDKVNYEPFSFTHINKHQKNQIKIGVAIGSSNNPRKQWPVEHWSELIRLIKENHPTLDVFLYGVIHDKKLSSQIMENSGLKRANSFVGKTSILELAQEFSTCRMVVGCDSGAVHLASAIGTPTLTIFGPTNSTATAPCFELSKIEHHSQQVSFSMSKTYPTEVIKSFSKLISITNCNSLK